MNWIFRIYIFVFMYMTSIFPRGLGPSSYKLHLQLVLALEATLLYCMIDAGSPRRARQDYSWHATTLVDNTCSRASPGGWWWWRCAHAGGVLIYTATHHMVEAGAVSEARVSVADRGVAWQWREALFKVLP